MAKPKTQVAVLTKDKKCKSCVRFRNQENDKVTTSIYVQNDAFDALDKPEAIKVSVEAI